MRRMHAFPLKTDVGYNPGMMLRDWFAGQALAGFLADGSQRKIAKAVEASADRSLIQDTAALASVINEQLASGAYALADAMLLERDK